MDALPRPEWLRRFRARLKHNNPGYTDEALDEVTGIDAHEALSAEYPDDPEKAADETY